MVPLFILQAGRFVLLRHEMPPHHSLASHWDLLFENGDLLLTFRLFQLCESAPVELSATRLPDHRRPYLEYEGEVSGGRGTVSQVATGNFAAINRKEIDCNDAVTTVELLKGDIATQGEAQCASKHPSRRASTCIALESAVLQALLEFDDCCTDEETIILVGRWDMSLPTSY